MLSARIADRKGTIEKLLSENPAKPGLFREISAKKPHKKRGLYEAEEVLKSVTLFIPSLKVI